MEKYNYTLMFGHLAIYIFVWIFAITAHRAVTAWMSNYFGDDTAKNEGRITFSPFAQVDLVGTIIVPALGFVMGWLGGGIPLVAWGKRVPIDPEKWRNPRLASVMVTMASTFASFGLALIAFLLLKFLFVSGLADNESFIQVIFRRNDSEGVSWLAPIELILWYGMVLNIALATYSLIPFPPFAGGTVLSAFLPKSLRFLSAFFERYGLVIALLLIYIGVFHYILNPILILALHLLGIY